MRPSVAIVLYSSSSLGTLVDEETLNECCTDASLHNSFKTPNFRPRWHGSDREEPTGEFDIDVV
jgi:hypothetical protein